MSNFICSECGKAIIDLDGYITGCEHYPIDDFTELSGKHMDRMSQDEADILAYKQMRKQEELF